MCYEVDDGSIVVEPIINLMGGLGFFADKAARVLFVYTNGTEKVLYRAAEHWSSLKPPGLLESQIRARSSKLTEARERVLGMNLASVLGESDSTMGSGVDHRLYYLEDALAIVTCDHQPGGGELIEGISILKPGLRHLTLKEWLETAQTGSAPNAVPRHQ
ncbi:MAG TPA: hypothetical protein VJW76_01730 [Verrucomicrobiae bacterium]|nr:hypothetical protein [Verrucomicrobiae bacterium]